MATAPSPVKPISPVVAKAAAGSPKPANVDPTKAATIQAVKPAPFTIVPLKGSDQYLKILFYAAYGAGKTTLAGTSVDVPDMRDVIMVNCESGEMSITDSPDIQNVDLIDQVRTRDFNTVANVHDFLKAHCAARDANDVTKLKALQARMMSTPDNKVLPSEITEDPGEEGPYRLRRYKTVIIDSLSEVDIYSMYDVLSIKPDAKIDDDTDIANFPEFRKNNQKMQLTCRAFRDLPMNVIFVCSAQYTQNEIKEMFWTPRLTGQLANHVQGFVDVVGFIVVAKVVDEKTKRAARRLWVQPVGKWVAKNRIASFRDPFIDHPTMAKIQGLFKKAAAPKKSNGPVKPQPSQIASAQEVLEAVDDSEIDLAQIAEEHPEAEASA